MVCAGRPGIVASFPANSVGIGASRSTGDQALRDGQVERALEYSNGGKLFRTEIAARESWPGEKRQVSELSSNRHVSTAPDGSGAALHSLLVPIDLTAGSDRVLRRLSLLPLAVDARVTLLHVVPEGLPAREQRRAEGDAHKALTAEMRHLRKQIHKRVEIEPLVMVGAAAKQIAACATDLDAELIVMGRGRGRVLRDIFLGSTAERVIRRAQRPVLAVRLPARAAYRRPALALDLDQAAYEIVRLMLIVLPPPRPGVEVIHAFDNPYRGMLYPSLSRDDAEEKEDEIRSGATHALAKLLASALAQANVRPDGLVWKTHVKYGSPRIVVEKAIKKADTDLLVLGTRGHSGAAYVFLGTVAGDLLRAARCDVLIVPPAAPSVRMLARYPEKAPADPAPDDGGASI